MSVKFLNTKTHTLYDMGFLLKIFKMTFTYKKHETFRYIFMHIYMSEYLYLIINARTIRAIRTKNKFELFIENWSYSYDE